MTMTTVLVLTGIAAIVVLVASSLAPSASSLGASPLTEAHRSNDHAVRLLAGRYARGEINVDEYRRMLIVLSH